MNKTAKLLVTLALLGGFGAALWFSLRGHPAQQATAEAVAATELNGLIAVDVEDFFKNPRVVQVLAAHRLPVQVTRIGSRDMAARVLPGATLDFFFPSAWWRRPR
ncbi:hypothetical protein [Rhizobacter sp. Root16D2]|uniref:hypothetical protein n=1 Tax=Rhizobacter sp. Root16D2 TaxID=1736479 RepID=UPI0006F863D4|nr:hypothetical protein [Rhizobacter sp. Root16D2]KRB06418.1 hypothetical protein ASE08_12255 [Rhizobacter sp. Root16D2]